MANVTIYTTPTCHFCHQAKEFFKENNIEYTEKDVASDLDARREMVEKTGQLGVPVIEVDEKTMVGYDHDTLAGALGIKA
ncbi:MAG: glutaredoxin family protein [Candidatus Spechtbacterales bacterium]